MNPTINTITGYLEGLAPLHLQESYDNAGLITGNGATVCTGVLCCLDVTEAVIDEAVAKSCNLVVAHHPVIFKAIKKITGSNYVEKLLIKSIKADVAIYAIHTNLDNVNNGVNATLAARIGLDNTSLKVLLAKTGTLAKLYTYVPNEHAERVREAMFEAGAGAIGNYTECSFNTAGEGTFRPSPGTNPFIGIAGGPRETVQETRMEFIFPAAFQKRMVKALFAAHPYEEVAYEVVLLANEDQTTGSGLFGSLPKPIPEQDFLEMLQESLGLKAMRHTNFTGKMVKTVALCGGSGSFLTGRAIAAGADVFITSDIKYHEFFDAEGQILLVDIGHYESEQYTIDLLVNFLRHKIPTFAVLKTDTNTNPVKYFV